MYRLTLTDDQAQVLSTACEVVARLGMNQLSAAFDCMPVQRSGRWDEWRSTEDVIKRQIDVFIPARIERSPFCERAWSLHTVIRHRLAWDRAVRAGLVASADSPRKRPEMMQILYNEPHQVIGEPNARIEVAE